MTATVSEVIEARRSGSKRRTTGDEGTATEYALMTTAERQAFAHAETLAIHRHPTKTRN